MSNQTPEQIEAEIVRQREDLADTVDALQHRLDVKGRTKGLAKDTAAEVKDRATTESGRPRPELGAAVAVAVVVVVGLVLWRRRS